MDAVEWARPIAEESLGGAVECTVVKARPWACTWRFSGPRGVAYLKAAAPATAYEAALTAALASVAPDRVPAVLAVDPAAGRLLLADAGPTLRELSGESFRPDVWRSLVSRFAGLQRRAEPLVGDLPDVPHELPADVPRLLADAIADSPCFTDLTPTERDDVSRLGDHWAELAARLERYGIAPSVQHGDLHDGNVAVGADGRARFFDFGDASVSHPFTTMLVPLRVAGSLGATAQDLAVLKGAYLGGYADRAPTDTLAAALDLALDVAPAVRVTSWVRALADGSGDGPDDTDPRASADAWAGAPVAWLRGMLTRR
jgi:phosphotransferase family enzyme